MEMKGELMISLSVIVGVEKYQACSM